MQKILHVIFVFYDTLDYENTLENRGQLRKNIKEIGSNVNK